MTPRFRRVVLWAVALACALAGAPEALAGPVKDPNAIACPAAPAGWTALPVARTVRTPGTVSSAPPEYYMSGGNLVTVSCVYFASEAQRTTVTVAYALPSDPNPFSDFNYGCGKGDVPWNAEYGTFRAASIDQWAYATFASTRMRCRNATSRASRA